MYKLSFVCSIIVMSDLTQIEAKKLLVKSFVCLFNGTLLTLAYLLIFDTFVLLIFIYFLILSFVYYLICYKKRFNPIHVFLDVYRNSGNLFEINSNPELTKSLKMVLKSLFYSFILMLIVFRLN